MLHACWPVLPLTKVKMARFAVYATRCFFFAVGIPNACPSALAAPFILVRSGRTLASRRGSAHSSPFQNVRYSVAKSSISITMHAKFLPERFVKVTKLIHGRHFVRRGTFEKLRNYSRKFYKVLCPLLFLYCVSNNSYSAKTADPE